MNSDTVENSWLERTVNLSPFAGKTAIKMWITADAATPPGPAWDDYYSDIAIYSTDGTVTPIYYRQNSIGLSYFSGGSISNPQASVQVSNSAGDAELPANTTTYYLSDQIGSARMLAAAGGWPVSMDIYYPFGQEQSAPADNNHYKFTGKERDSESGNDYFGARYYASTMGRFLSPDPLGGHLDDPQTLNKYVYVRNNPLSLTDPTGLDFYLQCTQTKDNASTCQSQTVGHDKNGNAQTATVQGVTTDGKFTATQIGNDANGNLVDKTTGTGAYTASVNGSGVQLSNNGGDTSSTGVFVNHDANPKSTATTFEDAGWANGGNLSSFLFTFTNSKLEANQTAAGYFGFGGTPGQAGAALQRAGFDPHWGTEGGIEYRSRGSFWTGANSGHFIVNPNILIDPGVSLPAAGGNMHFGEHNPYSPFGLGYHCISDKAPCF